MSIENKLQTILNKVLEKKISIFATQNMKGLNDQVLIDDIEIKTELEKLFFENHRDAFYLKIDYNTSSHEIESRDGQEAYILAIDTKLQNLEKEAQELACSLQGDECEACQ